MYVYEEIVDGQKLSELINTQHCNVKYLPNHKLPTNIVSLDLSIDVIVPPTTHYSNVLVV